jgi:hypothetical protein
MSTYSKSSNALKKPKEDELLEIPQEQLAEVIPFPDVRKLAPRKPREAKKVRLQGKYLHCRGRKIPILQFQKAGYDKLLKLLVKEIG